LIALEFGGPGKTMRKTIACVLALVAGLVGLGFAGAAQAQVPLIDEVRGGVFAHSVDEPGPDGMFWNFTRIQDANVELLFTPPDSEMWRFLGSPRPHVGATVNFGGLESMAYAGLTWTWHVFETPLFVEGTFGAAITNAATSGAVFPARNLGCPIQFRESASLGYQVTPQASVMLTLEHASHAYLCGEDNRGLTNLGVRFGYKF
jgi:lipid A 3-O-deacylase